MRAPAVWQYGGGEKHACVARCLATRSAGPQQAPFTAVRLHVALPHCSRIRWNEKLEQNLYLYLNRVFKLPF